LRHEGHLVSEDSVCAAVARRGKAHLLNEWDPFKIRGLIRSKPLPLARTLAVVTLHHVLTLVNGDCDDTEDSALGKKGAQEQRGGGACAHHVQPSMELHPIA
jgi:hypothetical protein